MPVGQRLTCRCRPWSFLSSIKRSLGYHGINFSLTVEQREKAKQKTGVDRVKKCFSCFKDRTPIIPTLALTRYSAKEGGRTDAARPRTNIQVSSSRFPFLGGFDKSIIASRWEEQRERVRQKTGWSSGGKVIGLNSCSCRFSAKEGAIRTDKARPSTRLKVSTGSSWTCCQRSNEDVWGRGFALSCWVELSCCIGHVVAI